MFVHAKNVLLIPAFAAWCCCAGTVDYEHLSETARESGDLVNAARFLERAREDDAPEVRRRATLRLAEISFDAGDAKRAAALLAEYRKQPAVDTEPRTVILAARLKAAAGETAAALDMLNGLLNAATPPAPAVRDAALAAAGETAQAGKQYLAAAGYFAKLGENAKEPARQFAAFRSRVYALQCAGQLAESAKLLAQAGEYDTPQQQREVAKLVLFQLVKEGKSADFAAAFNAYGKSYDLESDPLLYAACVGAAQLPPDAAKSINPVEIRRAAFNTAPDEANRRAALRDLANTLLAANRNQESAEALLKYLELFPAASDRIPVLMQAGRLYAASGNPQAALKTFDRITADGALPAQERIEAAREAAQAAQAAKLPQRAEANFRYIIEHAPTAAIRQDGYLLLGEYCFGRGEFGRAADAFASAASEAGPHREQANFRRLQALVKGNLFAAAQPLADSLAKSATMQTRIAAIYYQALLLERNGKEREAREQYLKFIAAHPKSDYALPALFDAARLSQKLKLYREGATLFESFALKYPAAAEAPQALFHAMQCAFIVGEDGLMRRASDRLSGQYPDSPYTIAALFRQVDYLRGEKRYPAALAVLERIDAVAGKLPEVLARSRCDQAQIQSHLNNNAKAQALIDSILADYPKTAAAADAALLGGNLASNAGRYEDAVKFYSEGAKLRAKDAFFVDICRERIADAEFSQYAMRHDRARLDAAMTIYRDLAHRNDPAVAAPALYKLGRAQESAAEWNHATATYAELLYRTAAAHKLQQSFDPVWAEKAAYAGAMIYLKKGSLAHAREALRFLETARRLRPESSEELNKMIAEIRRKYRL